MNETNLDDLEVVSMSGTRGNVSQTLGPDKKKEHLPYVSCLIGGI